MTELVDRIICAASDAFKNDGEVLITGIGVVPRLAASLAMLTCNKDIMMTDSEAYMVSEPVPVGPRGDYEIKAETWMGFSRIFDNVWSGKRHALVGPTQIDRFGQANISMIGSDYKKPKVQMLGARGFPGNSISHANSFFVPGHNKKVFVEGECDMVGTIGYNPDRLPKGYAMEDIDIRWVITNLCIMDFETPNKQMRIRSLHPGVSAEQVQENTGFELVIPDQIPETPAPTAEQLDILARLDPHNIRAKQIPA
jgi:glutaconate CoA-transferase subunit B